MSSLLPMRGVRSEIRECRSISDSDVVATEQTWPHVTIWTLNYADHTPTPGTTCSGAEFVFVYLRGQSSIRKTLWLCAALMWHDVSFQSLTILLAQCTSCPWDFILPFPKVLKDIWMCPFQLYLPSQLYYHQIALKYLNNLDSHFLIFSDQGLR